MWQPWEMAVYVIANLLIFLSYTSIPISIYVFVKRSRFRLDGVTKMDQRIAIVFSVFIACCGFGHLWETIIFWYPWYRFAVVWHAMTAFVSVSAALMIGKAMPRLLRLWESIGTLEEREAQLEQANRLLLHVNRKLAQSNKDLESFAYVASHDLQAPLRRVRNFAIHLSDEYGDKLDDPAAQKYLDYIVDGSASAQDLINGLLQFSRTGRDVNKEVFDLSAALDDALQILDEDIQEKGAEVVRCESMPSILGDRLLLARVFQNLIGNAIKFRHPDRSPRVRICCEEETERWVVSVADNGIGFDPQFADQIFMLFRRLRSPKSKNGSGLGLAICKRIVQRHGGDIWVESTEGEGSTFYFSMPRKEGL